MIYQVSDSGPSWPSCLACGLVVSKFRFQMINGVKVGIFPWNLVRMLVFNPFAFKCLKSLLVPSFFLFEGAAITTIKGTLLSNSPWSCLCVYLSAFAIRSVHHKTFKPQLLSRVLSRSNDIFTDTIFIMLQEMYIAAGKPLYLAFVDLEKAFDRVHRKVLWWALRSLGVKEWADRVIQGIYTNARSRVRVGSHYSEEFWVGVCMHQEYVLSPLLFILILEVLSCAFSTGVPWELLFADDLAVIADSLWMSAFQNWKPGKGVWRARGWEWTWRRPKFMISGSGLF